MLEQSKQRDEVVISTDRVEGKGEVAELVRCEGAEQPLHINTWTHPTSLPPPLSISISFSLPFISCSHSLFHFYLFLFLSSPPLPPLALSFPSFLRPSLRPYPLLHTRWLLGTCVCVCASVLIFVERFRNMGIYLANDGVHEHAEHQDHPVGVFSI